MLYLEHSYKVDIISVNHFINESAQFSGESLVLFEPGCSEMKTQRSPVGFKMAIEVVSQNSGKLVRGLNIGARRNQVTTRQSFIEIRVVTTIQFVDDHLPNRVAPGGASLGVTVAFVGHAVVQGVGPNGDSAKG